MGVYKWCYHITILYDIICLTFFFSFGANITLIRRDNYILLRIKRVTIITTKKRKSNYNFGSKKEE